MSFLVLLLLYMFYYLMNYFRVRCPRKPSRNNYVDNTLRAHMTYVVSQVLKEVVKSDLKYVNNIHKLFITHVFVYTRYLYIHVFFSFIRSLSEGRNRSSYQ
jgi:hypothetical protein